MAKCIILFISLRNTRWLTMNMHLFWHLNEFTLNILSLSLYIVLFIEWMQTKWKTCINNKMRELIGLILANTQIIYLLLTVLLFLFSQFPWADDDIIWPYFNRYFDWIYAARGRLSNSAVGDKSQVQDTGTGASTAGTGSSDGASIVTESRIKPRSRWEQPSNAHKW